MTSAAWELVPRAAQRPRAALAQSDDETPEEKRNREDVEKWLAPLEEKLDADADSRSGDARAALGAPQAKQFFDCLRRVVRRVRRLARNKFDAWAVEYGADAREQEPGAERRAGRQPAAFVPTPEYYDAARSVLETGTSVEELVAALLTLAEETNPTRTKDYETEKMGDLLQPKGLATLRGILYWFHVVRVLLPGTRDGRVDVGDEAQAAIERSLEKDFKSLRTLHDITDRFVRLALTTELPFRVPRELVRRGSAGRALFALIEAAWTARLRAARVTVDKDLARLVKLVPTAATFGLVYTPAPSRAAGDTGERDDDGVLEYSPAQAAFRVAVDAHEFGEQAFYSKQRSALTHGQAYHALVQRCSEMLGDDPALAPPPAPPALGKERRVHPPDEQAHWLALNANGKDAEVRRWWWLRMVALFVRVELLQRSGPPGPARYVLAELAEFLADPIAFASSGNRNLRVTGPPGVGKTTFMQKLCAFYALVGLYPLCSVQSEDENKVAFPSDFTGQYEGETEQKTRAVFVRGVGRLVPVDEAYAFYMKGRQRGDASAYGARAINLIVAFALEYGPLTGMALLGYRHEIDRLMEANPGFTRRFPRQIDIRAYKATELVDVFEALVLAHFGSRDVAGPYLAAAGLWREIKTSKALNYDYIDKPEILACLKFLTGESYKGAAAVAVKRETTSTESDSDEPPALADTFTVAWPDGRKLAVTRHEFVLKRSDESDDEYAARAAAQVAAGDIGNMLEQYNASAMTALLDRLVRMRLPDARAWSAAVVCTALLDVLQEGGLFDRVIK